ncbi:hypothetical protein T484DRAFT_1892850, partial [Baffinella frigidus]
MGLAMPATPGHDAAGAPRAVKQRPRQGSPSGGGWLALRAPRVVSVLLLLCALPRMEGLFRVAAVLRPGELHPYVGGPSHAEGRPGWWRVEVESCLHLRGGEDKKSEGDKDKKKGGKWWEERRRGAADTKSGERAAPASRGGVRGGVGHRGARGSVSPWSSDLPGVPARGASARGGDHARSGGRGAPRTTPRPEPRPGAPPRHLPTSMWPRGGG